MKGTGWAEWGACDVVLHAGPAGQGAQSVELGSGGRGRAVRAVRHDGFAAGAAQRIMMYIQTDFSVWTSKG